MPALINKLRGIYKLVERGDFSNSGIWKEESYTKEGVGGFLLDIHY